MTENIRTAFARGLEEARRTIVALSAEKRALDRQVQQSEDVLVQARVALAEAENGLRRKP